MEYHLEDNYVIYADTLLGMYFYEETTNQLILQKSSYSVDVRNT